MKAVFDALQPPAPASGEPTGKAKRPKTSSSTILVVWQNKSVLLFQLRSEHFLFHVKLSGNGFSFDLLFAMLLQESIFCRYLTSPLKLLFLSI